MRANLFGLDLDAEEAAGFFAAILLEPQAPESLDKPAFSEIFLGFLLGFASLLMIFLLSSDVAAHFEICETGKEGANECARYGVIGLAFHLLGRFLKEYDGLITAIATIAIAWFTLSLRRSTDKLWDAGERQLSHLRQSSEHQLRAYVYVEKTSIRLDDIYGWLISFQIKNFGQTPAHQVKLISRVEAVDWNDGNPTIPVADELDELGSMAPYGDFFETDPKLHGEATILTLRAKAIYLVGRISYLTVFGDEERYTNFRFHVGGDVSYEPGALSADDTGNDAT